MPDDTRWAATLLVATVNGRPTGPAMLRFLRRVLVDGPYAWPRQRARMRRLHTAHPARWRRG